MADQTTRLREYLERSYADAICAAADRELPFHRRTSRALAPRTSRLSAN